MAPTFPSLIRGLRTACIVGIDPEVIWSELTHEDLHAFLNDISKPALCPLFTATAAYQLGERAGFQAGLGYALYAQQSCTFKNQFHYLTVPVCLRVGGFKNPNRKRALVAVLVTISWI